MSEAIDDLLKSASISTKTVKKLKEIKSVIEALEAEHDTDVEAIEFEMIFDATYRTFTEEFNYTDGDLTQKNYYTDSGKGTKIWQVDYSYDVDGNLETKDIVLVVTGTTLRISFIYVGGNLTQKDRSWL